MTYNSDMVPPRVFNVVTSSDVNYNMDFVGYLMQKELERLQVKGEAPLTQEEIDAFRRQLISLVIVQRNVEAAMKLTAPRRIQLNG